MPVSELFLIRHGLPMSASEDPERALSPTGTAQVERTAAVLASVVGSVDVIYHSGKRRAEQTADILADRLSPPHGVRWRPGINPNDPVEDLLAELEEDGHERVLIAGHMPYLSHLASYLLCGRADLPFVDFATGAAAALARPQRDWVLRWMIDPARTSVPST